MATDIAPAAVDSLSTRLGNVSVIDLEIPSHSLSFLTDQAQQATSNKTQFASEDEDEVDDDEEEDDEEGRSPGALQKPNTANYIAVATSANAQPVSGPLHRARIASAASSRTSAATARKPTKPSAVHDPSRQLHSDESESEDLNDNHHESGSNTDEQAVNFPSRRKSGKRKDKKNGQVGGREPSTAGKLESNHLPLKGTTGAIRLPTATNVPVADDDAPLVGAHQRDTLEYSPGPPEPHRERNSHDSRMYGHSRNGSQQYGRRESQWGERQSAYEPSRRGRSRPGSGRSGYYDDDYYARSQISGRPSFGYSDDQYSDDYYSDEYDDMPMDRGRLPPEDFRPGSTSLLGNVDQARYNVMNAPRGGPLIDVPRKPPPPQTGLLGAISARERARDVNRRKPTVRAAELERERALTVEHHRLQEQRQLARQSLMAFPTPHPPPPQHGGYAVMPAYYDPYHAQGGQVVYPGYPGQVHPGYPPAQMFAGGRPVGYPSSSYGSGSGFLPNDQSDDEDDDVALGAIAKKGSNVSPKRSVAGGSRASSARKTTKPQEASSTCDDDAEGHEPLANVPPIFISEFEKFMDEKLTMKRDARITASALYRIYVNWTMSRPPKSTIAESGDDKEEKPVPPENEEEDLPLADQKTVAALMTENGFVKKLKKGSATVEEWYNVTLK